MSSPALFAIVQEEAGPHPDRSSEKVSGSNDAPDPNSEKKGLQAPANSKEVPIRVKSIEDLFELMKLHGNTINYGLPCIPTSKLEIYFYMETFHHHIEYLPALHELEPEFVGLACTALSIFWKDYQLVTMTLENLHKVAKIASNNVKRELGDKQLVVAAAFAICHRGQQNDRGALNSFDDSIIRVTQILYYGAIQSPDQSIVVFHQQFVKAITLIVPFLVEHLKRKPANFDVCLWIVKNLLLTDARFVLKQPMMVKEWLAKHGVVEYVSDCIKNFQFGTGNVKVIQYKLIKLVEVAALLRDVSRLEDYKMIVPNLLKFLNSDTDTFNSLKQFDIEHLKSFRVVVMLLKHIVEIFAADAVVYLMSCGFIKSMINAISFQESQDMLDVMSETIVEAVDKIKGDPEMDPERIIYASVVKDLCIFVDPYIVPSNNLKLLFAKIICQAVDQMLMCAEDYEQFLKESLHNGVFVVIMKALTISCYGKAQSNEDSDSSSFGCYEKDVLTLSHHLLKYEPETSPFSDMPNIICESLPEIVNQYRNGEHVIVDLKYCCLITYVMLNSLQNINDFHSDRWQGIRYLCVLYCVHTVTKMSMHHSTSLRLIWQIISSNLCETFLSSMRQVEIDLQKCEGTDAKTLEAVADLKASFSSSEACFEYLVLRLGSSLNRNNEDGSYTSEFRMITRLLHKIAENNKSKCQLKILKRLVFRALDVVKACKDMEVEDNVNKFIIYVFLEPS